MPTVTVVAQTLRAKKNGGRARLLNEIFEFKRGYKPGVNEAAKCRQEIIGKGLGPGVTRVGVCRAYVGGRLVSEVKPGRFE